MPIRNISNWGNYPVIKANVLESANIQEIQSYTQQNNDIIARGNGRCYGDAGINKHIISTLALNKFLSFDKENGVISTQSGVLLSEILEAIVPYGYFLPVTPGTKFITVGGAISADIHGKNHHVEGCFSDYVTSFLLLKKKGEIVECTKEKNSEEFWKTVGGMGLTGIILQATFTLKKIETAYIEQKAIQAENLDSIIALFEKYKNHTYSVAWIDCLQTGKNLGRSILMVGEHLPLAKANDVLKNKPLKSGGKPKLTMPFMLPSFVLNRFSIKAFNFLYYHKQRKKEIDSIIHYEPFFYPLDAINDWNKMYGKSGFTQYQFVIPYKNAKQNLEKILTKIAESGEGSFLAVLKTFGKPNPNAIMSFPMEGYTLALDFKINDTVFKVLNELDDIVLQAGGRLYLAKDVRMQADFFHKTYQRKVLTTDFTSVQSNRLKL